MQLFSDEWSYCKVMSQKNRKRRDFCETREYPFDGNLASFVLEPLLILQDVPSFYIGRISDGHALPQPLQHGPGQLVYRFLLQEEMVKAVIKF